MQKQIEILVGYKNIVQDVQTRQNSSYYAWDHLFYLKDANYKELIFNIATNSPSDDIDYLNENTVFEEATADIEIDDEIISNITNKKISIKNPLNIPNKQD